MSEKVFVTGAGIISALGNGTDATLKALLSGHSGIGHIRHLATEHREFPVGEVKLSDAEMSRMLDAHYPVDGLRTVLLGIIAAREAVASAALSEADMQRTAFISGTTVGGMDRDPTDNELQGGIIAYGAANILAALFGGLPTATYSQNVGIVTTNKVVNRTVFTLTGAFLLLAGVSPKFAAVLTTIPQCVLGGATITVFSTIAMTGMKLIASQDLTARNTTIVGLSAALGVGISQASASLSQFPDSFTMIFGKSPVVIATLMAVLLNLILPKEKAWFNQRRF